MNFHVYTFLSFRANPYGSRPKLSARIAVRLPTPSILVIYYLLSNLIPDFES